MLSIEQIVTLSEKGFSFDQIGTLNEILSDAGRRPEPKQEQKQEPDQEPEQEQKQDTEPKKKTGILKRIVENHETDEIKKRIDDLESTIKALQETNAKHAAHEPESTLTSEDVIKSFMEAS